MTGILGTGGAGCIGSHGAPGREPRCEAIDTTVETAYRWLSVHPASHGDRVTA